MPNDMEYKAAPVELKAAGDEGIYEGHFSVFGNIDDGLDIMHEGAFAKTLKERGDRIKVFYGHDWSKLIGPAPEVLEEDNVGLFAKGKLSLGSFWGKEVWELMKDGALTEGSIGYLPVKWEYEDNGIRHLREVKLYEISPVPLGMNPLTDISPVKALAKATTTQEKLEVFTALVGMLTDTDISEENAEEWKAAAEDMAGRLAIFAEKQSAAEPREHSALMARNLRLRAAELALHEAQSEE